MGSALRLGASLIFAAAAQVLLMTPSAAAESQGASHCAFLKSSDVFRGACGTLSGENPVFAVAPSAAVRSGRWRSDLQPRQVWSGTMTEGTRDFPVELEIYEGRRGILRTEYGWFAVSQFTTTTGLSFELDGSREIQPSVLDQEILERAAALLSSPAAWNRADNRVCPDGASVWSIYCALWQAMTTVTGGANHRRPALEVVREIVEARTAGRNYHHRLMEYNNDPTTSIDAVHSLFREAVSSMKDPDWLAKHGFATSPVF